MHTCRLLSPPPPPPSPPNYQPTKQASNQSKWPVPPCLAWGSRGPCWWRLQRDQRTTPGTGSNTGPLPRTLPVRQAKSRADASILLHQQFTECHFARTKCQMDWNGTLNKKTIKCPANMWECTQTPHLLGYGGRKGRGGVKWGRGGSGGPLWNLLKITPQKWNGQSVGPFQSHNSVESKFFAPNFPTVLLMLHTQMEATLKTAPSSRNLNFIREELTKKEKRKKFMHFSLLVPLWPSLKQAKTGKQSPSGTTVTFTETSEDR